MPVLDVISDFRGVIWLHIFFLKTMVPPGCVLTKNSMHVLCEEIVTGVGEGVEYWVYVVSPQSYRTALALYGRCIETQSLVIDPCVYAALWYLIDFWRG